ncbi:MAG: hypothetical protein ACI9GZ_004276 [Bacteroidia bacterium]
MKAFSIFSLFILINHLVHGQLSVNPIFSDGAIIQQNQPIKIWGKGNPNEEVLIEIS